MADLAQLTAWRDALMAARYRGVRIVEYDGKRITYASDGEMAAALADLNRQIWSCPRFTGHSGGGGLSCDELAGRAHLQP